MSGDTQLKNIFSSLGMRSSSMQERGIRLFKETLSSMGFTTDPALFPESVVQSLCNQVTRQMSQNAHSGALQDPIKTAFFELAIDSMMD